MPKGKRSERIQVYLIPQAEQDKLVLDVWNACSMQERPQEIFRAILRAGIRSMVESGDMPAGVVTRCRLEERLNVRAQSAATVAYTPPQPFYPHPAHHYGAPPAPAAPYSGVIDHRPPPEPAPVREPFHQEMTPEVHEKVLEPVGDAAPAPRKSGGPPDTMDILGLMGSRKRN